MVRRSNVMPLPSVTAGDLVGVVRSATADMGWLTLTDQALVELAIRYAQTIDDAHLLAERLADLDVSDADTSILKRIAALEAMADAQKAIGWLGPSLASVLKSLGGGPAERKALGVEAVRGRLAELRAARAGNTPTRKRNTKTVDPSAS
jgi:hypothetical protein